MPAKTPRQRRAAGAELARREKGARRQKKGKRPFGTASLKDLRAYARKPRT